MSDYFIKIDKELMGEEEWDQVCELYKLPNELNLKYNIKRRVR